jgi:hypothetical protein
VFAGRRSTDKLYLALQNAYCARALNGYAGTSSVYALEILDGTLGRQGIDKQRRRQMLGAGPKALLRLPRLFTLVHGAGKAPGCWDPGVAVGKHTARCAAAFAVPLHECMSLC